MVDVLPLNGLIYNKNRIRNISDVISPPYDVISPLLKKKLYKLDPCNIINLILPSGSSRSKYSNANKILCRWIENDVLKFDSKRCFYIFEESYYLNNKRKKIFGFIGLTKIEPYNRLKITPHEQTLPEFKQDRLNLLKSCRSNFGFVYTLYRDRQNKILDILKNSIKEKPFIHTQAKYDSSLTFKIWRISRTPDIEEIKKIMKKKKLIIADGHHRYETSESYRQKNSFLKNSKGKDLLNPENFILTLYIESSQKDIQIYPTHRKIKFKSYPGLGNILEILNKHFYIDPETFKSYEYLSDRLLHSKSRRLKSFYIYGEDRKLYFITLKSSSLISGNHIKRNNKFYLNFDADIINKFLMNKISKKLEIKKIDFSHSVNNVIKEVDSKEFDIGILLSSLTVKELEKICISGALMPQKSTYFYPKPCTGLVMYKFDR